MGIVTRCCSSQFYNSDLDPPSKTNEKENQLNNIIFINKIPEVKDSIQGLNYLFSKECSNIITKISRNIFTKKLCKELSPKEIYIFLKKVIDWILSYKILKKDFEFRNYISKIQIYTKLGTKKLISELNTISHNFKKEDEDILIRSLSDWIMLIQLIISLNNNLWMNKNIEKMVKNYVFDGCYFLIMIKKKYSKKQKETIDRDKFVLIQTNSIKINSDTKNEIKKLVHLVEDFTNDLIQCK